MRTLTLVLSLLIASGAAAGSEAGNLYKQARKAEKAGEIARAYILYTEAAALEPTRNIYALRAQALQSRAALAAKALPQKKPVDVDKAAAEPDIIVEPEPHFDSPTARDYADARKPQPPTELKATPGHKDLDFRGDSKSVFEQVAKAFGLDCVFDYDYAPGPPFHLELQQADYRDALHALQTATSSFVVPLSERVFLVVKDTPQKRKEVEPSVSISIPLPEPTTAQDFTAMIAAVQQSLALEKVAWDTSKNIVVIRDRISKVTAARKLFDQLLYPRAQVEIEVEFIEWNRSDLLKYGLSTPTSFPLVNLTTFMHNMYTVPSGISGLALFGGGASLFGLGLADVQLIASMSKSRTQTLLHSEVRAVDGQPASMHIGDRYPVLTSGYFGPQSVTSGTGGTGGTGAFGSGDGAVSYTVAANTSSSPRNGTVTVANQIFTVTQEAQGGGSGAVCTYALSADTQSVGAAASTGSVDVTTASGCAWTPTSTVTWITITSSASGSGDGTVTFSVAANPTTTARSGTLTIGGKTLTVTQDAAVTACSYSISPATQSFLSSTNSGTVLVTADAGCNWTATTAVPWIFITSGQAGSGSGAVSFQVTDNFGVARTGTITIAGSTFVVSQAAAGTLGCVYSLIPSAVTAIADGQKGTFSVSTPYGCTWSPVSNVPWITITGGGTVSSGGSITGSPSYVPPPSFSFEDLGFSLKATPHIHGSDEVTLEVEAEFKLLAGTALNGIPVVANRQIKSTVTLKEGEWAMVSGMMSSSEARTISGIAGVATVPLIGRFLRQNNNSNDGTEVMVVIKPRLLTPPPSEYFHDNVRVGSEERPFIPL